jgi:Fcf2 pre-rRNA processing
MGTVIESSTEYFSARIKKKDRKETIVEELLADQKSREYLKKKYNESQEKHLSGGKKWYKKLQERKNRR